MKIKAIGIDTDMGRRTVQFSPPIEIETTGTIPPPLRSFPETLWGMIQEVVRASAEAEKRQIPEFSYVRLADNKAQVTCRCGWEEDPMPVGPFDPAEALAAAGAAHPQCVERPEAKA